MATAAEIRNKAAKKLGVLSAANTLQSDISDDLDDAYTEAYRLLEEEGLASWALADEVPAALVHPMTSIVALSRVNEYATSDSRYQRVVGDGSGAMRSIRRYSRQPLTEETPIENF
jgi:hypothetical protein